MRFLTRSARLFSATTLGSALLILFAVGCGTQGVQAPDAVPVYTADNPPPILRAPGSGLGILSGTSDFYNVVTKEIDEDGGVIEGNRYTIVVPPNAVDDDVDFSISEWSPDVLDVEFGPHGISFNRSVRLMVDISGTNADAASMNYDAVQPTFYWFNDATGIWEALESKVAYIDGKMTLITYLQHFSRYAVGGGPTPPGDGTADW